MIAKVKSVFVKREKRKGNPFNARVTEYIQYAAVDVA